MRHLGKEHTTLARSKNLNILPFTQYKVKSKGYYNYYRILFTNLLIFIKCLSLEL